jgi:hypothetical protein
MDVRCVPVKDDLKRFGTCDVQHCFQITKRPVRQNKTAILMHQRVEKSGKVDRITRADNISKP